MNKIIFLDVDGVLNRCEGNTLITLPAPGMVGAFVVEKNIVEVFNWAVKANPDVRVVVSSTWRKHTSGAEDFSLRTGVDASILHPNWKTCQCNMLDPMADRPEEVARWLDDHPEVTNWAVLDDVRYAFNQRLGRHCFIRTNERYGLTLANLRDAIRMVGGKMPERETLIHAVA